MRWIVALLLNVFSNCRFKSVSTDSGDNDNDNDADNADNYPLALQSLA